MMRLPIDGSLLNEKFWPHIRTQTRSSKEPPAAVMLMQANALKSGPTRDDSARWLKQAFLIETNNGDTHPCLKDRLRAMNRVPAGVERGEFPEAPPRPSQTAAEFFLGSQADVGMQQLSEEWSRAVAEQWAALHERDRKLAEELTALEKPANAEELWTRAVKLMELRDEDAAFPLIDQLLRLDPQHVGANFVRGQHLLEQDDPRGVEFIETAMAADPTCTRDGCGLLYGYYQRTGQREKLRPLENRVDAFQEEANKAQHERANITAADQFLPHELKPEQLAELRKIVSGEPEIVSVAVAKKQVRYFPKTPCYVIALRIKVATLSFRRSSANQELTGRVADRVKLPGNFLVFVDEQNLKALAKKIFPVPGATVYDRSVPGPPPLA
ncbi:MAG TPA: hypothetical protein VFZ59_18525 [Verrucomicrobiae bacterium]|nr:hypothetical protein [Verrucomicrobiae bacterium]